MTVPLGILLACCSAGVTNLGFLWRHRGAVAAPPVAFRHPWSSAVSLFRQKWWALGFAVAALAWTLHVAALALAPLSIVQAALASGFVFLAILADRVFGFEVRGREWGALALVALGVAVLAATGGQAATGGSARFAISAIIAFEGALVGTALALIALATVRFAGGARGVLFAASGGLLFGATHVAIKAITGAVAFGVGPGLQIALRKPAGIISPLGAVIVLGAIVAFFASALSLQLGEAVAVIATTAVAGNASAILAGVVVFGDPLGGDALEVTVRVAAFVLLVGAGVLVPGPLRAARSGAEDRAPA